MDLLTIPTRSSRGQGSSSSKGIMGLILPMPLAATSSTSSSSHTSRHRSSSSRGVLRAMRSMQEVPKGVISPLKVSRLQLLVKGGGMHHHQLWLQLLLLLVLLLPPQQQQLLLSRRHMLSLKPRLSLQPLRSASLLLWTPTQRKLWSWAPL